MKETSQTASSRRERELGQRPRVRPLEHGHARIGAQPRVQLAVADVERDHARRAALEQDVGEAAGRGADVDAVEAGRVDAEPVEPVRELLAAARDVRTAVSCTVSSASSSTWCPGLVVAGHETGHDERLRLRPRLREPALDEEDVEALPRHASQAPRARAASTGGVA